MALVPLTTPYSLTDATMAIGADDFTEAVSQVDFAPNAPRGTFRGIGGKVRRTQATAEWDVTLGLAQDLAPTGLLRYLLDHEGESKVATFTPKTGGPAVIATILVSPAGIGGTAGADTAVSTVTLAVDGRPEFDDTPGA